MALPLLAIAALSAGGNILGNMAEQGANAERQNIVNQGLAQQQAYRNNLVSALGATLPNLGNVNQAIANRTGAVNTVIGDTLAGRHGSGALGQAYMKARANMAISNAERRNALAKTLGAQQGMQASHLEDYIQSSRLGSQFGDINRQAQQQLFNDRLRMNAVRPNAGLQFLGESMRLGAALGGLL